MYRLCLLLLCLISIAGYSQTAISFKTAQTDTLYGKVIKDPYRSMEDTSSAALKAWMHQEADKTQAFFASIPGTKKLYEEMISSYKNSKQEEVSNATYWRGKYYALKLMPGAEYESLYEIDKAGHSKLLLDPKKAHPEIKSDNVRLVDMMFSPNSPYLLYVLTIGGYEFDPKFVLRNMETGKEIFDTLYTKMGSAISAFDPDDPKAFYYEYFPQFNRPGIDPNRWWDSMTIRRHVIGTAPSTDKLMIDVNPSVIKRNVDEPLTLVVNKDAPYVLALVKNMVANEYRIYVAPRKDFTGVNTPWKLLSDWDDKINEYVMKDHWLYLLTTKEASNGKVLRVDMRNPSLATAVEIMPHSKKILSQLKVTRNDLLFTALDAGVGKVYRIPHGTAKAENIPVPVPGNVKLMWADASEPDFVASITSYTRPLEIYQYNKATNKMSYSPLQQYHNTNIAPLVIEEVAVKSHDGVEVPMTIVYKKGLKLDGTHPIALNAYGAYGKQDEPYYYEENMYWFNRGGIRAYAHVRGGGVYGDDWHKAGQKNTKPNTWKDVIACGEWLIAHKYATNKNLVVTGGSAGGITMGRALTERPDLFGGAMIYVGALDMIRFETSPNGYGNIPEFGSIKTEEGFKALYEMSTYHHVEDGTAFPPVLFTAGVNDNRVPVWMTLKTAARMREANKSNNSILLRLDFSSGHGATNSISEQMMQGAQNWVFYFWRAGLPEFQPTEKKQGF